MKSHILLALYLMVVHVSISASHATADPPQATTKDSSAQAQAVGVGFGIGVGVGQGGDTRAVAEPSTRIATDAHAQTQGQAASPQTNISGLSQAMEEVTGGHNG